MLKAQVYVLRFLSEVFAVIVSSITRWMLNLYSSLDFRHKSMNLTTHRWFAESKSRRCSGGGPVDTDTAKTLLCLMRRWRQRSAAAERVAAAVIFRVAE